MKKTIAVWLLLSGLISCSGEKEKVVEDTANTEKSGQEMSKEEKTIEYLFPASLASDWKIGNPEHVLKVQEMYKILMQDSGYDAMEQYLADSINNIFYDDKRNMMSKADFIKMVKRFRSQFKTFEEEFIWYVPLRSDGKNIDQVSVMLEERVTWKNGKRDSTLYHENWRIDEQGKFYYRGALARYSR
jgi:hypothetical protein